MAAMIEPAKDPSLRQSVTIAWIMDKRRNTPSLRRSIHRPFGPKVGGWFKGATGPGRRDAQPLRR